MFTKNDLPIPAHPLIIPVQQIALDRFCSSGVTLTSKATEFMNNLTGWGLALAGLLLTTLQFSACRHDPFIIEDDDIPIDTTGNPVDTMMSGTPCDPETVYFTLDVLPILQSNCAFSACHDAASAQDGVDLSSYEGVIQSEEVVVPFNIAESKLYRVLTEDDPDKQMPPPPATPLSTEQINLIAKWILQGAEDLECDPELGECSTIAISYSQDVRPILQNSCVGCHSGNPPAGNIDLSSHAGVAELALNGRLVGAISHAPAYEPMPQGGNQLASCSIDQITAWVNDGAPNN